MDNGKWKMENGKWKINTMMIQNTSVRLKSSHLVKITVITPILAFIVSYGYNFEID